MIDWARVEELQDEVGQEDFAEVVVLFLSEVEERLEMLDPQKPAKDTEEDLHFLKGSALNLGFREFAALCEAGEQHAASGQSAYDALAVKLLYEKSKTVFLQKLDESQAA